MQHSQPSALPVTTDYDLRLSSAYLVDEHKIVRGDLYLQGQQIGAIVSADAAPLSSRETVDLQGAYILPGLIDAHTHFQTFSKHCDDIVAMTRSAAHGGITTVLAHVMGMNASELTPIERIQYFVEAAAANPPWVDYAFHAGIGNEPSTLENIPEIIELGITSFKMFMAYRERGLMVDDGHMLDVMKVLAANGGLAMVHAELGDAATAIERALRSSAAETSDADAFLASRPPWIEAEAARRAIELAERAECPLYIVHISNPETARLITERRVSNPHLFAETCPQYLTLSAAAVHDRAALLKIAPPLRDEVLRRALIEQLRFGHFDVVGSDHAPYHAHQKLEENFWDVPVGIPGTETLALMTWRALTEAGRDIRDLARLLSASPARILGLFPGKGSLAPGSDADLTIVRLDKSTPVSGTSQHNESGYSPYDEMDASLKIVGTFVRGRVVLWDGALQNSASGRLLRREPNYAALN